MQIKSLHGQKFPKTALMGYCYKTLELLKSLIDNANLNLQLADVSKNNPYVINTPDKLWAATCYNNAHCPN